ncbi:hypothetical protein [Amycolatopsis sp. CA-230715]|uniref:hypothetical protein n=1 Tax=Amycolatopsis sp. CA-230715 TaxID=2745196 RepID=UPI001C016697|nr:hypothetical protein [Amycolatopsis sp. CA-230715]QWF85885.1 hypothetical protein HUW46_09365 [Amycolatopsis sp. CA-230715]
MIKRLPARSLVVLVVASTFAALVVLAGQWWAGTTERPAVCDLPTVAPAGERRPAGAAPGHGGIRVVEQGASAIEDGRAVSVGAIVENSSDYVAYRTRVRVGVLDGAGRDVLPSSSTGGSGVIEVPILEPGERIGIGQTRYLVAGARFGSATITPTTSVWLSRDTFGSQYTSVTGTVTRMWPPVPAVPSAIDIRYTEISHNCGDLTPRLTAMVFRDHMGRILGGSVNTGGMTAQFADEHGRIVFTESGPVRECAQGEQSSWVLPGPPGPPPALSRAEVFPYCDLDFPPPETGVDKSVN